MKLKKLKLVLRVGVALSYPQNGDLTRRRNSYYVRAKGQSKGSFCNKGSVWLV